MKKLRWPTYQRIKKLKSKKGKKYPFAFKKSWQFGLCSMDVHNPKTAKPYKFFELETPLRIGKIA